MQVLQTYIFQLFVVTNTRNSIKDNVNNTFILTSFERQFNIKLQCLMSKQSDAIKDKTENEYNVDGQMTI